MLSPMDPGPAGPVPPRPPPRPDETDMSNYSMPRGAHVTWDDLQQQDEVISDAGGRKVAAAAASSPPLSITTMPFWAWIIIAVVALLLGFGVGYLIRGARNGGGAA